MSTQIGKMTELEALNTMLATIGSSGITSIDNPQNADALMAKSALNLASREVQSERWYFNVEHNFPLTPNSEGEITLPNNIVNVDFLGRFGERQDITIREGKLYDRTRHTYKFDKTLYANIQYMLDFNDLPETAKIYVTIKACRIFQDQVQCDTNSHTWTREDEELAKGRLLGEELRVTKPSFGLRPRLDPNIGIDL